MNDDQDYDQDSDAPRRGRRVRESGYRDEGQIYEKQHRGGLILALGLIGIMVCPITGIFAWFLGGSDLKDMEDGLMDPSGKGLTSAGRIIGLVATILMVIQIILVVGIFGMMFAVGGLQ
jgi:hypothetical protein